MFYLPVFLELLAFLAVFSEMLAQPLSDKIILTMNSKGASSLPD